MAFLVPGSLDLPTGGYTYDRRMIDGLRQLGWSVDVHQLDESFPSPTRGALTHAAGILEAVPDGARVLIDGLAFSAMPEQIEREAGRLRMAALVHLPLGADVTIDENLAARRRADERRALAAAALVIVTGPSTRTMLAAYGLRPSTIVVVEPGTARATIGRGSGGGRLEMLSVATLNPGKGHELLLRALAALARSDWHLTCVGSLTRHPETVGRVRDAISALQLGDRVTLLGELTTEELDRWYDRADLFVLATLQETYGMAVAEALAHGLPVVSTTTGAIPDLVGTDAGLLVPPGSVEALTTALAQIVGDPRLRRRLADGACRARGRLRSWEQASAELAVALERIDTHG